MENPKIKTNCFNHSDVVGHSFTIEDMRKAFDAGGDWRIACKNLSDGVFTKEQWANTDDFEDFIRENYG